eukprot:1177605-Prorocentrum_minimum.AAC.4
MSRPCSCAPAAGAVRFRDDLCGDINVDGTDLTVAGRFLYEFSHGQPRPMQPKPDKLNPLQQGTNLCVYGHPRVCSVTVFCAHLLVLRHLVGRNPRLVGVAEQHRRARVGTAAPVHAQLSAGATQLGVELRFVQGVHCRLRVLLPANTNTRPNAGKSMSSVPTDPVQRHTTNDMSLEQRAPLDHKRSLGKPSRDFYTRR